MENATAEIQEVYKVLVIDNRVRLYKGRNQISYEECGSHKIALEVAEKLQKEHNAGSTFYGPQMSIEKLRHLDQMQKRKTVERAAKKELKKNSKSKEEILQQQEENLRQLAMLEGRTIEQVKADMGIV